MPKAFPTTKVAPSYIVETDGTNTMIYDNIGARVYTSADASTSINWAISQLTGGGTVYCTYGDYSITAQIIILANIELTADPHTIFTEANDTIDLITLGEWSILRNIKIVTPEGDENAAVVATIQVNGDHALIENVELTHGVYTGIEILASHVEVRNSYIYSVYGEGITIDDPTVEDIQVENVIVDETGLGVGIYIRRVLADVWIERCRIYNTTGQGIHVSELAVTTGIYILNCRVRTTVGGMCIGGGETTVSDYWVVGCNASYSGNSQGIDTARANNVHVLDNTCHHNAGAGIDIEGARATVKGNICYLNERSGIVLYANATCPVSPDVYHIVTGNICYDNATSDGYGATQRNGIWLTGPDAAHVASYCTISENKCYETRDGAARTQQYGIYEDTGGDYNNISNNTLINNVIANLLHSGDNNEIGHNIV